MLNITKPQMIFTSITIILSIVFFLLLNQLLMQKNYGWIWALAPVYGLVMFLNGFICGKKEYDAHMRIDLGYRYHLLTYCSVNVVAILAAFALPYFREQPLTYTLIQPLAWGLGLYVHSIYSRKSIKGYERSELFD